ncbi:MAG: Gfo/Idh/MocA family oxidoreductase [Candidatus Brocadiia bacterium]|jgi:hypothetical protein|nr:Gfo/Idh/MocA family oxidoreductase [Candidatus Brocadiia bacterium]
MAALVPDADNIRLAMLGMVDGNGHPYSWSAIFNGYDREAMADCPYATIPEYLGAEDPATLQIEGARVTHIWTDDPTAAERVAAASRIPNVVETAADVIGQVDAVIIATDIGHEHVDRARPFIEAGLPIFVDKPLVDNEPDLQAFHAWVQEGKALISSSALRYSREFAAAREQLGEIGELRFLSLSTAKTWERYGVHALEGLYPLVGPGFTSARNTGTIDRNIVHLEHERGVDVVLIAIKDMHGGFGHLSVMGTKSDLKASVSDTFYAFKTQLQSFVDYLRTGERPIPWPQTVEMMKIIIAGTRSRKEGGRKVPLDEISERTA